MSDFIQSLPFLNDHPTTKKIVGQCCLTVISIVLCMLKDPSLLVGISSFGLVALTISFIILGGYGISAGSFSFKEAYLCPTSANDFMNNLGIFVYSLAFTEYILPQAVWLIDWVNDRNMWRRSVRKVSLKQSQLLCCWWLWSILLSV